MFNECNIEWTSYVVGSVSTISGRHISRLSNYSARRISNHSAAGKLSTGLCRQWISARTRHCGQWIPTNESTWKLSASAWNGLPTKHRGCWLSNRFHARGLPSSGGLSPDPARWIPAYPAAWLSWVISSGSNRWGLWQSTVRSSLTSVFHWLALVVASVQSARQYTGTSSLSSD